MKAADLMVGDYVTFSDCIDNPPVILIKIEALGYQEGGGEDSSLVRIDNEKACDIIDIDDEIVGIPLTPEILEKNGFLKTDDWFCLADDYYDIAIIEISDGIWRVTYYNLECSAITDTFHICFVHELQHALKLCGIEKTIEL